MRARTATIRLDEDMHVHSTYSDGTGSLEENVAAAERAGLRRLGCVDHVRHDTDYLPRFVEHVRRLRESTEIELVVGVEAKILDLDGGLDLPSNLAGADWIYAADHQLPCRLGLLSPRAVRTAVANREIDERQAIDDLVDSMIAVLLRHENVVFAHPFSILAKCGMSEASVPLYAVDALASIARAVGAEIEVDERWRCPGERIVRRFLTAGVPVRCSTDAHRPGDIGRYRYAAELEAQLGAKA